MGAVEPALFIDGKFTGALGAHPPKTLVITATYIWKAEPVRGGKRYKFRSNSMAASSNFALAAEGLGVRHVRYQHSGRPNSPELQE